MNDILIVGRLTEPPRAASTQSGTAVTTLRVAVSRRANKEKADYFTVVTWRGLAENCAAYLEQGQLVAVRGELQTRSYQDKNGSTRWTFEITADEVEFLTKANRAKIEGQAAAPEGLEVLSDDEDLPF